MIFKNREEAAELLSKKLGRYKNQKAVVFAIPRGSIPMAKKIAESIQSDFQILFVHKLGSPQNPELAMGAIGESGEIYALQGQASHNEQFLKEEAARQLQSLKDRKKEYSVTFDQTPPALSDATAILVDDGMATGATVEAGLMELKKRAPKKVVLAVPVASASAIQRVKSIADEIIVLDQPEDFWAVGQFYESFPEVTDNEIQKILRKDQHEPLL